MNISKKWRAAAAGVIALALVGGGAASANAAEGDPIKADPQSNGSHGSFYIYDGNTGELLDAPGQVYNRSQALNISASPTDFLEKIMGTDVAPTWGNAVGDTAFKFIARPSEMAGGTNSFRAYEETPPTDGGLLGDDFTFQSRGNGNGAGIESVFSEGGDWYAGLAFTNGGGAFVYGAVYRTIHVDAVTGAITVDPVEVVVPETDVVTEDELVSPELGSAEPAIDTTVVPIAAGAANADKTLNVAAFAAGTRVELGTVVLDGTGSGSVDVAGKGLALATAHKLFVYDHNGADEVLVGWDSFTLTGTPPLYDTTSETDLTVEVTNSGRFELVAPAATTVDLGDVRRNRTTTAVALGNVTVFDDRDVLAGWNLNINAAAFQGAGATTVAATALGYEPVGVTLTDGVTLGAAKTAGEGTFGILAQGAAGSATGEFEGAVVDTNLTFKAPINAAKGVHTSTLTLDLVSK